MFPINRQGLTYPLGIYFPLEREEAEIRSYNAMRKFLSLYSYIQLVLPNALKECL